MQALNLSLFEWIGAGHHPHPLLLALATALAERGWWMCVLLLGWVAWRHPPQRAYVLAALAAAGVASLAAHALAESIASPRPFMLGLSPPHIE
ncbi:MAG: PA-phosphatase, partial [Gammaproteobacteria bacterium]|nr:PA-phosphatase [Gammaproteobacteria bacterium]